MNKILFIIILNFFSHLNIVQAQYAPLELGNVWVYQSVNANRYRVEIVDSAVIIDTIKYFGYAFAYQSNVSGYARIREDSFYVNKEDSTFPEPLNEFKYYKKNAQLGDTWGANFGTYTIIDTFLANVFDSTVTVKILNENFGLVEWDYAWTEEFGKLSKMDWLGEVQHFLRGCVINGNVFGDTSFVVTVIDDNIKPIKFFRLEQNYPNPFNPITTINYSIPIGGNVKLDVYNSLGEIVNALVNEWQPAGSYKKDFIADNIPSGVYFYTILTGEFRKTMKMILLK